MTFKALENSLQSDWEADIQEDYTIFTPENG